MTKHAIIFAVILIPTFVSCSRKAPTRAETEACVFSVSVYRLDSQTKEFERVTAVGGYDAAVPCDYFAPDYLDIDETLQIRTFKCDRETVDFAVRFNGVEKNLTATSAGSHVDFENGEWRVGIQIDTISLAPFVASDTRLNTPVYLCITEVPWVADGDSENHIRNRKILAKKEITNQKTISRIQALLSDSNNFELGGADCFHPRTAIRFGVGNKGTDLLFCRECSWIYVYTTDEKGNPFSLRYGLGRKLHDLVDELRTEHFPDHIGE